jgi:DNA-binding NarL/FixJ family response regulator
MSISPFHLLFLGEDLAWSKLSQALAAAPRASIKIHRAQSLNELVLILAGGRWHAVALDVHAWNFQGLHYVDKVRSEYPSLPILALCSSTVNDLENRAKNVGASHTITLESMNSDTLLSAIFSTLADLHAHSPARNDSTAQLTFNLPDPASHSRTQAISHALSNLLCVITANADLLAEHVNGSAHGEHSLTEIKKAAKSASDLMRQLE